MTIISEPKIVDLPNHQIHGGDPFPLAYAADSDMGLEESLAWIADHKAELVTKANAHGAVVFRGFPLATAEHFDAFVTAFDLPNFRYEDSLSNAVRINRTERVFTANEAPAEVTIYLHHEMAQTPIFPSRLFFFCEQPAEEGGATPLCRSDVLLAQLQDELPEFVAQCESKGLKYSNTMPPDADFKSGMGRSWRSTFGADSADAVEQRLQELGYSWEWLEGDCLRATTGVLMAVRDLGDGRKSYFNQLIAAFRGWKDKRNDPSKAITLGDGTPLNPDHVLRAAAIADELSYDVAWQAGDVALVDNFVTMHGRRNFQGTRKVLASLVA